MARALYCSVDPDAYPPLDRVKEWDLSYLGTYSDDRQPTLEKLLIEPARRLPHLKFCVAGPQYPKEIEWPANVERIDHLPPSDHAEFYAKSGYTLNVTRADMIAAGWSPSVRLFEAASCATPVISDTWDGLDSLFEPGRRDRPRRKFGRCCPAAHVGHGRGGDRTRGARENPCRPYRGASRGGA